MLLFITSSRDATANLLFEKCYLAAFRLNIDLWQDYSVVLQPSRWEISNPIGLTITNESATHCFWWKALNSQIAADDYLASEITYVFRELYGWFLRRGLVVGNPPDFHNRVGKMQILHLASDYFRTPDSLAGWNLAGHADQFSSHSIVAKSLSGAASNAKKVLFTTAVKYEQLDRKFPWFLQNKIDARNDVTVMVCGHQHWAFARSRKDMKGLDWRRTIAELEIPEQSGWEPRPILSREQGTLRALCRELGVQWGRFDFLEDDEGLILLEFNANGQWAFLDFYGSNGLMEAVAAYLSAPPSISI
jgi:hypothetical protein